MSTYREQRRQQEREHVRSELKDGRSPAELHKLIDEEVVHTVASLRDADQRCRRAEAQRDCLRAGVEEAENALEQFNTLGGADELRTRLAKLLKDTAS